MGNIQTARGHGWTRTSSGAIGPRAFTLIDVMVSMLIVAVLISLLLPTLSGVRETARQVICGSNVRQHGMGIIMYADDNRDRLVPSLFVGATAGGRFAPEEMVKLRVAPVPDSVTVPTWDGLGHLYAQDYLSVPGVFYCPSHNGEHRLDAYADAWKQSIGTIVGNYQYRGRGPNGSLRLSRIEPGTTALVADGLRTQADYNHEVGCNVLRADMAVLWFSDNDRKFASGLPKSVMEASATTIQSAWDLLDQALRDD